MQFTEGDNLYNTVLNAPIGFCILNAETLVAEIVNNKFLEVAGKKYEEIYGKHYWDAFSEVRSGYEIALAKVIRTGEAFYADDAELKLIRQEQEETIFATFVYSPILDKNGKVNKVAVWVLERTKQVNERLKVEEAKLATQRERDRLKSFFMQAPCGICILDGPNLVYELVNPYYQQSLPNRQLLGRSIFEAVPELIGTPQEELLRKVYSTGESYQITELLIPLAGYEGGPTFDRYFNFSYEARRDENGDIDGVLTFMFEVTKMIKVQEDLKRAREQADQQKRVYETITSSSPDLMYVFDLNYHFTFVNQALLSMWGKTWEKAIGKRLLENGYEPWHAEMHEREIDQVRKTKKSIRGEVSFPHATLGKRIYDYILTPIFDEYGEVEAVAGTTRDITEHKQYQELLAQTLDELKAVNEEMGAINEELSATNQELIVTNEELSSVNFELEEARQKIEEGEVALRLAINAANFGTWFIHSVTREFITDARLKELFGYYTDEELSIEAALAQITDEYREYVANKLEQAINNNGDYDVTYPVIGFHDQKLRWLRAIGNLKADPSVAYSAFTGVVMDITQQHLAAEKIEHAEENLRMAMESGELAVWHFNENTGNIVASPRFYELFGLEFQEEVAINIVMNQIDSEYHEVVKDIVNSSFTKGTDLNLEYSIHGFNDGKQRWIRSIGKFVKDEKNGNYITGVIADITEQKMDDIRKNDFIGMVSHELKTPLTSLKGYIQVLLNKLKQREDTFAAGMLERANVQVSKMTSMINGFLNVSRLESGKIYMQPQVFDISNLIKEVKEEFFTTISSHTLVFEPIESILIDADKDKIEQVIHNLISNAIKYSPANSVINVSCIKKNNQVRVSVKDQGMGITRNNLSKIFDRYYRVEGDQMFSISGFGIGLYLCKEIIQRHHGEIGAESEFGKGSTFTFTLPLFEN